MNAIIALVASMALVFSLFGIACYAGYKRDQREQRAPISRLWSLDKLNRVERECGLSGVTASAEWSGPTSSTLDMLDATRKTSTRLDNISKPVASMRVNIVEPVMDVRRPNLSNHVPLYGDRYTEDGYASD